MKMKSYIITALLTCLIATACQEEELPVYSSGNYIYFTPDKNGNAITSECNFGYLPGMADTLIGMEITLLGYMLPEDREYEVTVDGINTTAVEGTDFELPAQHLFGKGEVVDTLWVRVKNNGNYAVEPKKLTLRLESNEHFTAGPLKWAVGTFEIKDYVTEPSWWNKTFVTNRLGAYSDIKYHTLIQWMGVVDNLYDYSTSKLNETAKGFKTYLIEEWNSGNHIYEEDGMTPLYSTIPIEVDIPLP